MPPERLHAELPDHVWAIDFQFDQTADGHNLNLLHVVDEFTREALAIECHHRIDAYKTVDLCSTACSPSAGAPRRLCAATTDRR